MRSKRISQIVKTIPAIGNPQTAMMIPGSGTKTARPTSAKAVIHTEINQIVPALDERGMSPHVSWLSGSFLNQLLYIFLF